MTLKSPLGRALGHGSARGGVEHWWAQRMTAIALVPLYVWLAIALLALPDLSYPTMRGFVAAPLNAILLALTVPVTAQHAYMGVHVVCEDYIHNKPVKIATMIVVQFGYILLAAAGLFAILKVATGGQP